MQDKDFLGFPKRDYAKEDEIREPWFHESRKPSKKSHHYFFGFIYGVVALIGISFLLPEAIQKLDWDYQLSGTIHLITEQGLKKNLVRIKNAGKEVPASKEYTIPIDYRYSFEIPYTYPAYFTETEFDFSSSNLKVDPLISWDYLTGQAQLSSLPHHVGCFGGGIL